MVTSHAGTLFSQGQGIDSNRADFIVGPDTKQWGRLPHTVKGHNECGKPQNNPIYLPAGFITEQKKAIETFGYNLGTTSL